MDQFTLELLKRFLTTLLFMKDGLKIISVQIIQQKAKAEIHFWVESVFIDILRIINLKLQ